MSKFAQAFIYSLEAMSWVATVLGLVVLIFTDGKPIGEMAKLIAIQCFCILPAVTLAAFGYAYWGANCLMTGRDWCRGK